MTDRLTSALLVNALMRRAQAAGGQMTVLRKGDPVSGTILLQAVERGEERGLFERVPDYVRGGYQMMAVGPAIDADPLTRMDYIERRRSSDPDLWVVELDIAEAERFAAVTICST